MDKYTIYNLTKEESKKNFKQFQEIFNQGEFGIYLSYDEIPSKGDILGGYYYFSDENSIPFESLNCLDAYDDGDFGTDLYVCSYYQILEVVNKQRTSLLETVEDVIRKVFKIMKRKSILENIKDD